MSAYQDVVAANLALAAWALTEAAGASFAPYIGGSPLALTGVVDYRQAAPPPGGFSVGLHVGAELALAFVATVNPPTTTEVWAQLPSITPPASTFIWYYGNNGANGSGIYVANNSHIHLLFGGRVDTDTGLLWPDTNWHLFQLASDNNYGAATTNQTLAIDGIVRWRGAPIVPNAPAPNTLFFGGTSTAGAATAFSIAWPAFYPYLLSPGNMQATELATTAASAALLQTVTGGGAASGSQSDLLTQILASVRKVF